jgi:hypothetical protein
MEYYIFGYYSKYHERYVLLKRTLQHKCFFFVINTIMDDFSKYKSEYESYPPYHVRYRKNIKYHISHERFVVPWQMEEKKMRENVKI